MGGAATRKAVASQLGVGQNTIDRGRGRRWTQQDIAQVRPILAQATKGGIAA
jgi:hypothetical protein